MDHDSPLIASARAEDLFERRVSTDLAALAGISLALFSKRIGAAKTPSKMDVTAKMEKMSDQRIVKLNRRMGMKSIE
jgi:hypothetical protein